MKPRNLSLATLCLTGMLACTDNRQVDEPVFADRSQRANADEDAEGEADDVQATMAGEAPADSAAPEQQLYAEPAVNWNTERYAHIEENGFKNAAATPLSTFSIDVDTAAYSLIRRHLNEGHLPPGGAVRIEEMLNYFDYKYESPKDNRPFAVHTVVSTAPWNDRNRIVRVGIKGRDFTQEKRPNANLVFLIDVSGSMMDENKLPLLKRSMNKLVGQLGADDSVAIVVYAGASGVVLKPTSDKKQIIEAFDNLQAGGGTNGSEGIKLAYQLAAKNFQQHNINRVILATDGDFNVGVTSESELVSLIEEKAQSGIFLSVLGFGSGNYNDSSMEKLADKGNGNYAYIDTIDEATKVLVKNLSGTLVTIAKDVKIQIEFNPETVASYRLIGYENRALAAEDFNDDKKDAGEIGAGHTVTALYEVVPASEKSAPSVDDLRYQNNETTKSAVKSNELLTVKVRYKTPDGNTSMLLTSHVSTALTSLDDADDDFRFATAVAGFGMKLAKSKFSEKLNYADIVALGRSGLGLDDDGYRAEFLSLVRKAEKIDVQH